MLKCYELPSSARTPQEPQTHRHVASQRMLVKEEVLCAALLPGKAAGWCGNPSAISGLENILDQKQLQDGNTEGRQTLLN